LLLIGDGRQRHNALRGIKLNSEETVLDQITPVILTYNEENNIARTLVRLRWARDVVVVDSFSTDKTVSLVKSFPNVRLFQRAFDSHARQWNYAIKETVISTEWVLALDADYYLTEEFIQELSQLTLSRDIDGYTAGFQYCIFGHPLRGTLYPPVTVLFRNGKGQYVQEGHTQRVAIDGPVSNFASRILHDDRKPLSHWLQAQDRYMRLEAQHITEQEWSKLRVADKLRRFPLVAPFLVFWYCYIGKGLWFDGRFGLYYALQRMLAECVLALRLIERNWAPLSSEQHSG
jgi:glycosyltransferase involved in cell wall biosynthesis